MLHTVFIERTRYGVRGALYNVTWNDQEIVTGSRVPEFDACRALLALGIVGAIETRRHGSAIVGMRVDIEHGAGLTVAENDADGPRIVRWRAMPARLPEVEVRRHG